MTFTPLFLKRWIGFFLLFFCVGYPVSLVIYTAYQVTQYPFVLLGGVIFTPLWALLVSYLYFRFARNDWTARLATAVGWIALTIFLSAILVEPVYGYSWSTILNWGVVNANWVNVAAILVGGIAAHTSNKKTPGQA